MAVTAELVQPSSQVSEFLASPRQMLINGQWVDAASGKTFAVENPATGDEIAQFAEGDKDDIDLAVAAAAGTADLGHPARTEYHQREDKDDGQFRPAYPERHVVTPGSTPD